MVNTYIPMPSLGHELGVMFGFMGTSLVNQSEIPTDWADYSSRHGHLHGRVRISLAKEQ
jgi:hypothetical protein